MAKVFGIDISKYQKGMNLAKAKAEGARFAIIRGAYHTSKDAEFETHYKNAKANGLNVGVYLYTMAKSAAEAKEEANFLIDNVLKGKQFELPIYIDIEDKVQRALPKKTNTAIVKAFCEEMEAKGYFAGVYANKSFFSDYLNDNELQKYAHWIAQWNKSCTYKGNDGVFGMWQFGGETNRLRTNKVAGMVCDQNFMYIDYPAIIKKAGLNGYVKAVSKPAAKPAATPAAKPAATTHTVKDRENLTVIAKRWKTTVANLVALNKSKYPSLAKNPNHIETGWVLKVK